MNGGKRATGATSGAGGAFPFSAVVGHGDAKLALVLNAVDRRVGGVLLRGQKGSAKTTLARGLAGVLGQATPFVELPVGATEDRVVGSIDIASALAAGGRRFHPGLLAAADGGVLYVDEVNLLPDHLVDVLLDVAASGVNRVEREGISETHPSRFVLVGSMNPEEGDLRPQLLDRFGLAVDVAASAEPDERAEAVGRRLAFDADPAAFVAGWAGEEEALAARVAAATPAEVPAALVRTVGALCASVGAEGLRADLVICRAAAALAGWEGRAVATLADVREVAPFALAHRRRRSPLEEPGIDPADIDRALDAAGGGAGPSGAGSSGAGSSAGGSSGAGGDAPGAEAGPPGGGSAGSPASSATGSSAAGGGPDAGGGSDPVGEPGAADLGGAPDRTDGSCAGGGPAVPAPAPVPATVLRAARSESAEAAAGRRSPSVGGRGRVVGHRVPGGPVTDLALGATVRAAAARHAAADRSCPAGAAAVEAGDLRQAVREQRTGNLIVLAVDASASMGVERRMVAVKEAVVSLLADAYARRDRVALVTFAGDGAEVVLRPTGSVEVARARLDALRTGGRTPLAAGIQAALEVAQRAPASHRPLLVVVSDGRATAAPAGGDPLDAARAAAGRVALQRIPAVVVDTEDGPTRLGLASGLAAAMGAAHVPLPVLTAGGLLGGIGPLVV